MKKRWTAEQRDAVAALKAEVRKWIADREGGHNSDNDRHVGFLRALRKLDAAEKNASV